MIDKFKQLAQEVIQIAKSKGADIVTTSLGTTTSFQVEVREGQIDALKEAGASGIHVSICKNHRRSSLSSNDLRMDTLNRMIHSTMEALPYMGEDTFYMLPPAELQGRADIELNFSDPNLSQVPSNEKIQKVLDLEKQTLALDSRLNTEQGYYSDMASTSVYADTNGFLDGYSKTFCSIGISMFVEDSDTKGLNTERKQTDGWYSCSRLYNDLEDLDIISQKACERTLRKIGAVKPKSQEVPMVVSPEMARSFLGSVASAMMGDNIFRKHSFLINKLNTKIANDIIQLRDDPLLPGKLGSRYFDSEGVKANPLSLIENGILKNYMLSTYAANKLDMTTTGHAGGISNLVLEPGQYTEEELIGSVKNGLYLTFMSGQGANITTGDYSRGAQGIWIRDGKLAEPVSEFTIASTFLDILNNITMIGSEVDERNAILAPAFKIDKIAVSGS